MKIDIYHASKHGNGAQIAEEMGRLLTAKGHQAMVHHIKEARAKELPSADLYVFGAPSRIGKPIGSMRRFLRNVRLPQGARYALFATQMTARPNKKTGEMPAPGEIEKWQRNVPIMDEMLREKGMLKVAEMRFFVADMKGPLEEGWQKKVEEFVAQLA
jgi:menaquinone-dependent protoporphyrinogen IX oxidase